MKKEIAYFGAGCFWRPQLVFDKIPGVIETEVGYMGGKIKNPSYEMVYAYDTGHIETIKVVYDSDKVSYETLLDTFWDIHDPTQFNRQGPDVGSQYKSVIFYTTPKQKEIAEKTKIKIQDKFKGRRVFTEIINAVSFPFYKAEEYHQKYIQKTGRNVC